MFSTVRTLRHYFDLIRRLCSLLRIALDVRSLGPITIRQIISRGLWCLLHIVKGLPHRRLFRILINDAQRRL